MMPETTENRVPLSKSQLWQRQRQFYQQQSIKAWQKDVPYYATSNPGIANSYAHVIINFIRETLYHSAASQTVVPFYIVELGTGSGTFSFYLLKRLLELAQRFQLPKNAFVYVMTDLVEDNINFWRQHAAFSEYAAKGIVDFACFDLEKDNDIWLRNRQQSITQIIQHPTIFIANYILDTLTQDVFKCTNEGLAIGLIKSEPIIQEFLPNHGISLNDIDGGVTYLPVATTYYEDPHINEVLARYQNELHQENLLFPIGSLQVIKKLQQMTHNRLLLLATDKAYSKHYEAYEQASADLIFHGKCFSMTVNFHAIGRYFEAINGDYYHQPTQHSIITSAFLAGHYFTHLSATAQALDDYLTIFAPGHLLTLYHMIETTRFSCSLEHILAYLSISHWDPHVFNACLDVIVQHIKSNLVTKAAIHDLCQGMKKIAENIYVIPGQINTLANIGLFFQEIQNYQEALSYYQQSLKSGNPIDSTLYNMGLCYMQLNQPAQALEKFNETVALNPGYIMAKGWIYQIKEKGY